MPNLVSMWTCPDAQPTTCFSTCVIVLYCEMEPKGHRQENVFRSGRFLLTFIDMLQDIFQDLQTSPWSTTVLLSSVWAHELYQISGQFLCVASNCCCILLFAQIPNKRCTSSWLFTRCNAYWNGSHSHWMMNCALVHHFKWAHDHTYQTYSVLAVNHARAW